MKFNALLVIALVVVCTMTMLAQTQPAVVSGVTIPASSVAHPGDAGVLAHTFMRILGTGPMAGTPKAVGPPYSGYFFETPASLGCVYDLSAVYNFNCNPNTYFVNPRPNGGSRAIAIVDAYHLNNAAATLQYFSTQFGIYFNPSQFQVVFAPKGNPAGPPGACLAPNTAVQPPNAALYGWDLEEALDIEWAHAMAPRAKLYLVEAQSNLFIDLDCAVRTAAQLVSAAGGGEVSMSYGSDEYSNELAHDPVYTGTNVVFLASSGDAGSVSYPSSSPNVISVGGTAIARNVTTGAFQQEVPWQDAGGGVSEFEPIPSFQNSASYVVGSRRGTPDVAAIASPLTPVWVFLAGNWYIVGGTSVACPVFAGIINSAGTFSKSTKDELSLIYSNPPQGFEDIQTGTCGAYVGLNAAIGYDLCTGVGSPRTYSAK